MARGVVVAAPASGAGKTTVAVGLMAALRAMGGEVQPFKVGPDFIDPTLHRLAAGRPSYNLDGWMVGRRGVVGLFRRLMARSSYGVVEGVMGLFDSAPGDPMAGSTAQVAAWLGLPVLLVVDCSSLSGSVAPLVQGFARFHPQVRVPLVVLNRVGSARHARLLTDALAGVEGVEVAGVIPREEECAIPSRHLGLVTAQDLAAPRAWVDGVRRLVEEHLDLQLILHHMAEVEPPPRSEGEETPPRDTGPVIAVAMDRAFCFYYQENLDLLARAGARLRSFSPLQDHGLPPETRMVYLGGGYPELHAQDLAANGAMIEALRDAHRRGLFIYGECGGMLYLGRSLQLAGGEEVAMAGILPLNFAMEGRFQALGYRRVELLEPTPLGPSGAVFRGHEFHYSRVVGGGAGSPPFRTTAPWRDQECHCGVRVGNTLASYCHLHLASRPGAARELVENLRRS